MTTTTRTRRVALSATLLFAAAACSTNGSTAPTTVVVTTTLAPGTPLRPPQQKVYDLTRSSALAQGVAFNESCLTNVVAQFSDADAELIIDATPKGNTPTLSAQGTATVQAVPGCVVPATTVPSTTQG